MKESIKYCPGTLAEGYETYSNQVQRRLFNGQSVNHILPYYPPEVDTTETALFLSNRKRISISGVQLKLSLVLDKAALRLTEKGEQGQYILKPIPHSLKKVDQVPANEHLTMQIAQQVYGINTAENALIFFKDGTPAYITKRFDIRKDGLKWQLEDFATLAGKTVENAGADFKYQYSYERLTTLLKKYIPAYRVELEKLFSLILFNYLFSNGDAHLKNFSLLESPNGDYLLSPAYDLINTRIHVDDTDFALYKGLFEDDFQSTYRKKSGHVGLADFQELANRMGITKKRQNKLIAPFLTKQEKVLQLIQQSFLNPPTKRAYLLHYQTKRNHLIR